MHRLLVISRLLLLSSNRIDWWHVRLGHCIDRSCGALAEAYPWELNWRIGSWYAGGALLSLLLAIVAWPWGVPLLWPTVALAVVASGYLGLGSVVYGKRDGLLPLGTRFLLAPVLLGHELSRRYYRRQCRPWDQVVPYLLMGLKPDRAMASQLPHLGVQAVLDLTAEFSAPADLRNLTYLNLPVLDLTAPTPSQLDQAVAFITDQVHHGIVYVHCKIGYSRSAAAVGAYLLASGQVETVASAVAHLRAVRPTLVIRPETLNALHTFQRRTSGTEADQVKECVTGGVK